MEGVTHQPKANSGIMVGTKNPNMMPNALRRIFASAAPTGPCASNTPPEQPLTERRTISATDMRQGRGCRCKRNAGRRDMETGSCMKARVGCVPERDVNIDALRVARPAVAFKTGSRTQHTGKWK